MEEVGTHVAASHYIHKSLSTHFLDSQHHPMAAAKKRSMPFQHPGFHLPQSQSLQQQQQQQAMFGSGFQESRGQWNPNGWDWDSAKFVAKPVESGVIHGGPSTMSVQSGTQRGRDDERVAVNSVGLRGNHVVEDDENLLLKLGGSRVNSVEENVIRPNKRVRSGSPATGNYPKCQVDDCKEDLSTAKDYHRRHKVCEVHSKATKAIVGKQMQRFCQQCSRFHPLSEFDEGKRSCRRRLAGHNRRRRKTQPDDVTSKLLPPSNRENANNGDVDLVNLLAILARAQGNTEDGSSNGSSIPNKDQLIQILQKINSLPLPADIASKLYLSGVNSNIVPYSSENENKLNGNSSPSSTLDLLAVLSGTQAGSSLDATAVPSQRSSHGSDSEKTRSPCINLQTRPHNEFASVGERSSTSYQSPTEYSDGQVQDIGTNLPLQLFSSSPESDSPPKLASSTKYFSSGSSNPMEERSPSSSPPFVQKLFPTVSSREAVNPKSITNRLGVNGSAKAGRNKGCSTSLDLFGGTNKCIENSSVQSFPYQAGYTSSSGSDHSPSSLNSDAQNRSGRLFFKLIDRDPSQLPGTLRTQIFNWLGQSPSEMESYIRPGCVVLSIYISMPSSAWEQLEDNLLDNITALVQDSEDPFWRKGRFLFNTGRQLASYQDGKAHLRKAMRAWSFPEVVSVSPLAVVGGQETTILLKGRNLSDEYTKVFCTHAVGYKLEETTGSASDDTTYDKITLRSFTIDGGAPGVLGRCFIEVENGFRGNSFPIIIANATICKELSLLESAFDEDAALRDAISEESFLDSGRPMSREDVLHFLNELGWVLQRKKNMSMFEVPEYKLHRFKFLFIFSVEHDFCALVKTLLDVLLEICLGRDELSRESLEMLLQIHLLNRAVKRRSRKMVDLLINYFVPTDSGKTYIFLPNLVGPGGITPLHLAACMSDSNFLVDTLTSDPLEIGLRSWDSLLDANGLSPCAYAQMRNNHSYNELVARKLVDKKNGQVSVPVGDEIQEQSQIVGRSHQDSFQIRQGQKSCSKCAVGAARFNRKTSASQGLLHRPYIHSMLAIAAVCVCVCLFLRGAPDIGLVAPFKWENLGYGAV
ncbi:squamosa promoter-binding-like protein 14 [Heracleum sosnowskyi]|uniref:Squamosa promoter-binding-like protein 14 n=1 Tax=Heracleum sosnowskyi TaxID=360622 RepID=A0AAD8N2J7_9APIA|nr:squamosa promoter-binding-like protein 14 [Heracleum sosnowskyi]